MDSILNTVKKSCGISEDYDVFDTDIIMHINSVFMILYQMGVGPSTAFRIEDETAVWTDFIPEEEENFESVKTYVGMKVRLMFDPPSSSSHMECINQLISELEWRLNFESELKSK